MGVEELIFFLIIGKILFCIRLVCHLLAKFGTRVVESPSPPPFPRHNDRLFVTEQRYLQLLTYYLWKDVVFQI